MSHSHSGVRTRQRPNTGVSKRQSAQNNRAVWCGFLLGVVGYLILSVKQPAGWGEGLWALLAFIVVPVTVGLVVNRVQAYGRPPRPTFFAGAKAVGWAMFFYASINLIVAGSRLGRPDGGGQEFLAGLLATVVYTAIAGAAAGFTNLALIRITAKRSNNGTAH